MLYVQIQIQIKDKTSPYPLYYVIAHAFCLTPKSSCSICAQTIPNFPILQPIFDKIRNHIGLLLEHRQPCKGTYRVSFLCRTPRDVYFPCHACASTFPFHLAVELSQKTHKKRSKELKYFQHSHLSYLGNHSEFLTGFFDYLSMFSQSPVRKQLE